MKPSQVVDFKALSGDPSDNYPGVYGVGPKTASSLLEKFQNFDNVYQNLNKLPDALKMKLKKGKEAGELSYRLAKIDNQTPIKLKGKQLAWKNAKIKELKEVLAKESFPSLVKRIEKDFGLIKKENCQQKLL
ncbi:MAG: 5'-3' exonuclease H3TH domain-containing protein [Candidatus Shapirobacteria bacterium]